MNTKKKIAFVTMLLIYALCSIVTRIAVGFGGSIGVTAVVCWVVYTMPVVCAVTGVIADSLFQKRRAQ